MSKPSAAMVVFAETANAYMRYAFSAHEWLELCKMVIAEYGSDLATEVLMSKAVRHADDGSTFKTNNRAYENHRHDPNWFSIVAPDVVKMGWDYIDG